MCFVLYLLFKDWSALHVAAMNNSVEAAKRLLLNGASVNATTNFVSIFVC